MNRYSAQKQYWKAKQTKQDKDKIADVVLLQKLQVRARGRALRGARGRVRGRASGTRLRAQALPVRAHGPRGGLGGF